MFVTYERAGASRTDCNGVLKPASVIDLMQDCSMFWMESEPSFRDYLRENGLGMFLAFRHVDILRLPAYGESLKTVTGIYGCRGFLGYRNTAIYDADGRPCALSWSIGTFVHMETGKMARLPVGEIEKIHMDPQLDMEYPDKKIVIPDGSRMEYDAVKVRRSDVDLYRHMNNARYVEAALEYLPADFRFTRMRLEYRKPAAEGDLLHPVCVRQEHGPAVVLLNDHGGKSYTVMEFSMPNVETQA